MKVDFGVHFSSWLEGLPQWKKEALLTDHSLIKLLFRKKKKKKSKQTNKKKNVTLLFALH